VTLLVVTAHALLYQAAFQSGSSAPTADRTEVLINHGEHVYVTVREKHNLDFLFYIDWWAVPVLIAAALVIHFGLRVRLFANIK
jgi:hypothetical protein